MKGLNAGQNRKSLTRACYLAAIVNSLALPAGAQENVNAPKPLDDAFSDRPLHYGPLDVHYNFLGSVVYDDNIYIQKDKVDDVIWTLAPGVMIGMGDYTQKQDSLLTVDYSPSFIFFTDETDNDAIDHDAWLRSRLLTGPWTFDLRQGYQKYSGSVVDVGDRVDRQIFSTFASVGYELSPKTSFEATGWQSINDYDRLADYNEWVAGLWADYKLSDLVKVGLGGNFGWVDVQYSQNQTYQRPLPRVAYKVTELVELNASAGIEFRQFQGDQDDRLEGVFSLGATYRPLENTSFTLEGYRHPQTSVSLTNQNYVITGVRAGVRQVLFEKYSLGVAGGFERADYQATSVGVSAPRDDDYFYVRCTAEARFVDWLSAGVFYQYRKDDSSVDLYSFDNHQVGLHLLFRF